MARFKRKMLVVFLITFLTFPSVFGGRQPDDTRSEPKPKMNPSDTKYHSQYSPVEHARTATGVRTGQTFGQGDTVSRGTYGDYSKTRENLKGGRYYDNKGQDKLTYDKIGEYRGKDYKTKAFAGDGHKSKKHGTDYLRDIGHDVDGFKNIYHKEEFGKHKKFFDVYRDSDYKKKNKKLNDYVLSRGGRKELSNKGKDYYDSGKKGKQYGQFGKTNIDGQRAQFEQDEGRYVDKGRSQYQSFGQPYGYENHKQRNDGHVPASYGGYDDKNVYYDDSKSDDDYGHERYSYKKK